MGPADYQCGRGPYREFHHQGRKGQQDQGIFVCVTTRAVHLEVVENLSTTSFIMCLQHLTASKGVPSIILSDNHRTFMVGEAFLLEVQQEPAVQYHLSSNNIR